ncbi:replication initiator protein [robinz microvirus RP_61]|nr:replication initiator protein [robinz microvirus RP_61]
MACFSPLAAFQLASGSVVFVERGDIVRALTLPCGQCVGCRLDRSRQWAIRILHESQCHATNSFVTLTYDEEHYRPSLAYDDFRLFLKRARYNLGPFRFFMCGEYGETLRRPHFHACLFGLGFADRVLHTISGSGFPVFRSATLESLWPSGFSSLGDLSFESAAYCARYVMKKVTGNGAPIHYREFFDYRTGEVHEVVPEFCRMSLKPGIGAPWISRFNKEVYRGDADSYVVVNGMKVKPPRYYDQWMDSHDLAMTEMDEVRHDRFKKSLLCRDDCTPDRLAVRETVTRARLRLKVRNLE